MIKEGRNTKTKADEIKDILFIVVFSCVSVLFWAFLYYKLIVVKNLGDYYAHNQFAKLMMRGEFETTYPGYQLIVGTLYVITGIDIEYISVAILSIFALFTVFATNTLLVELLGKRDINNYQTLVLSFILNIIQPIFTYSIRPGYSSGNGYISPTQAICKPFIMFVFLYTYRMYKDDKYTIKNQMILSLILFLSCIIKPVFAMAYVPAMGILYIFDKKKGIQEKIKRYIAKSWPLLITGIVLILQYKLSFNLKMPSDTGYSLSEGAGIKIGFLVAWKSVVSNVPLSILFAYFFPLVLFIAGIVIHKKNKIFSNGENNFFKICIFYGIVSLLYMSFLYQETRVTDCNFRNAWVVTFSIIYILCVSVLYRITKEKKISFPVVLINWGAFSVHIIMGLALYAKNIL